jgi:hypothetical protein
MREIAARVPSGLWRIPDGETGDRGNWIVFQLQKFLQLPWLVPVGPPDAAEDDYEQLPQLRLADGVDPAEVKEFGVLEEAFAPGGAQAFDAIIAALARCIDQVPARIPAGLHLCYGDYGHQHFKQPESLALQVRVLNAVTAAARRLVSFVSFTVPQYQRRTATSRRWPS